MLAIEKQRATNSSKNGGNMNAGTRANGRVNGKSGVKSAGLFDLNQFSLQFGGSNQDSNQTENQMLTTSIFDTNYNNSMDDDLQFGTNQ